MKSKQDPQAYQVKVQKLRQLWQLAQSGHLDLVYGDESGFQRNPYIPYGWQAKGQRIGILPAKGKTLSVLGLLHLDNTLRCYPTQKTTNAAFVVQCLDDFVQTIRRPTVVILDNAPIHRNRLVFEQIPRWQDQDLYLFFLPKYSPHLNRIEALWKKVKYTWIQPTHYKSWHTFSQAVKQCLASFGKEPFNMNFDSPFYL